MTGIKNTMKYLPIFFDLFTPDIPLIKNRDRCGNCSHLSPFMYHLTRQSPVINLFHILSYLKYSTPLSNIFWFWSPYTFTATACPIRSE